MSKQLNVNLGFSADTSKAKAQIQDLQRQLNDLVNSPNLKSSGGLGLTKDVEQAARAVTELQQHLSQATNAKTGNLDFSKLNESITRSGKSLTEYGQHLRDLGPSGQKAFQSLATSVMNAEVPLRRTNEALSEMWTSLKNAARWQLSSSILHGFMGTIQTAYGYAQDLNSSLNDIRIVTGQSVDQMARFAEQANKAARALSTTTTEYTNASLIYFQQGLSDKQVKERTDITIKLAQAAGQSVETTSDQLTAVWNNFYDGTQTLEHYADAMTKLGKDTASSVDEIAGGLEKFAAIGDTIGLSFDNAAAALATITATTRQSEEVVGTALKTIFARIQGLNLGETLDDGTTLNKYSEALMKVGINIKDQAGELKTMDTLLDELGNKWNTLGKDQQTALAQTVGGARQYTQLMALMENFDFYKQNLSAAQTADGTLQESADIYAESWEAASDRVRAAAEGIFESLVDDETFIDILNVIEDLIVGLDTFIDNIGGLGGVLSSVGAIATKVFKDQMASSLRDAAYSLQMMTSGGRERIEKKRQDFINEAIGYRSNKDYEPPVEKAQAEALKEQLIMQKAYMENVDKMDDLEMNVNKALMDRVQLLNQQRVSSVKQLEDLNQEKGKNVSDIYTAANAKIMEKYSGTIKKVKTSDAYDSEESRQKGLENLFAKQQEDIDKARASITSYIKTLRAGLTVETNIDKVFLEITEETDLTKLNVDEVTASLEKMKNSVQTVDDASEIDKLISELNTAKEQGQDLTPVLEKIKATVGSFNGGMANDAGNGIAELIPDYRMVDNLEASLRKVIQAEIEFGKNSEQAKKAREEYDKALQKSSGVQKTWADHTVNLANTTMSLISIFESLSGAVNTLKDPDASEWEKFVSVLTLASTAITMVAMAFGTENKQAIAATAGLIAHAIGLKADSIAALEGAAANGIFTASVWAAIWPVGLVVAAIVALVAILASLDTSLESAQKRFNKLSEDAQIASESLKETENAYNSLQETIDQYKDARNSIDDLTQGTEEFKQAVIEANKYARELIETYGVVNNFNAETGLIEIKDSDLNTAKDNYSQKVENARVNEIAAQSNKKMAANDLSNAKAAQKNDDGYWDNVMDNAPSAILAGGAMATAAVVAGFAATVAGPIGLIAAAAGALAVAGTDMVQQEVQNKKQISALENLQDAYINNGGNLESAMESLSISDKDLINALGMTDSELNKLCSEVASNTAAILQENKQLVDSNFSDNESYNNSEYKDELNTILADKLDNLTEDIYESDKSLDKTAQQKYADLMGYQWVSNDTNNMGTYTKGDGSASFQISDETARRAIAQAEALNQLEGEIQTYVNMIQSLAENGNNIAEGAGDALLTFFGGAGGSFNTLNKEERQDVRTAVGAVQQDENGEDYFNWGDKKITFAEADAAGYNSVQAYYNAIQAALNSADAATAGMRDQLYYSIRSIFDSLDLQSMSVNEQQNIVDTMNKIYATSGKEGVQVFKKVLDDMDDNADEFAGALDKINWENASLQDIQNQLDDMGIVANVLSNESLPALIQAMQRLSETSVETAQNFYNRVQGAKSDAEDGMLSAESIQALRDAGLAVDMYIDELAGGTGKLKVDVESFMNMLDGFSLDAWRDRRDEQTALADSLYERFGGNNYTAEDLSSSRDVMSYDILRDYGWGTKDGRLNALIESGNNIRSQDDATAQANAIANALKEVGFTDTDTFIGDTYAEAAHAQEVIDNTEYQHEIEQAGLDSRVVDYNYQQEMDSWKNEYQTRTLTDANGNALLDSEGNQQVEDLGSYNDALNEYVQAQEKANKIKENTEKLVESHAISGSKALEIQEEANEELEDARERYQKLEKEAKKYEKQAKEIALVNSKYQKGLEDLNENLEDYQDVLKSSNKGTSEYADTMETFRGDLGNLLNMDPSTIGEDFAQGLLEGGAGAELFEAALQGDKSAIIELREIAADEMVLKMQMDNPDLFGNLTTQWNDLKSLAEEAIKPEADATDFIDAFNEMAKVGRWTKEQIETGLAGLNVSANIVPGDEVEVTNFKPVTTISESASDNGSYQYSYARPIEGSETNEHEVTSVTVPLMKRTSSKSTSSEPETTKIQTYKIEGNPDGAGGSTVGSSITPTSPGTSRSKSPSQGGGGGSSAPKAITSKVTKIRKGSTAPRYRENTQKQNDLSRTLEKAANAMDKMYGSDKLKAMEEYQKLLKEEIKLTQEKEQLAKDYVAIDTQNLKEDYNEAEKLIKDLLKDIDKDFKIPALEFDEDGTVKNLTQVLNAIEEAATKYQDGALVTGKKSAQAYADRLYEYATRDGAKDDDAKKETAESMREFLRQLGIHSVDDYDIEANPSKAYEDIVNVLWDVVYNKDKYNWDLVTDISQENLDLIMQCAETILSGSEQLDESAQEVKDAQDRVQEILTEQKEKLFEELNYKLEIKLEINEKDLEILEYYISKFEDSAYKRVEGLAKMLGQIVEDADGKLSLQIDGSQLGNIKENIDYYKDFQAEVTEKRNSGIISSSSLYDAFRSTYYTNGTYVDPVTREEMTHQSFLDLASGVNGAQASVDYALEQGKIKDNYYDPNIDYSKVMAKMVQENGLEWLETDEARRFAIQRDRAIEAKAGLTQQDYIEGLQTTRDGLLEQLEALKELDATMHEYYSETIEMAKQEIDDYTERIEHNGSVLEHLLNVTEMLGSENYEMMKIFAQGIAKNTETQLSVAQSELEMLRKNAFMAEEEFLALSPDDENYEIIKANWLAAQKAIEESEEEVLSLTEQWVEQMQQVIQLGFDEAAKQLEEQMTNGLGFDAINKELERLNTLEEEYLTKTNQVYETTTLMNKAQTALDATDNKVAKQKLQNFINQTGELQKKNKLSKLELEVQQAQYDLLLAQIALEEAQNAKSTVRLRRDSEGNFGYVYTADENKVADAQQKVLDAENALYNISLEGQKEYTDKIVQAQQAYYEEIRELEQKFANREISEEEYYKALYEVETKYYDPNNGILIAYKEQYNNALLASTEESVREIGEAGVARLETEKQMYQDIKTAWDNSNGDFDAYMQARDEIQTTYLDENTGILTKANEKYQEALRGDMSNTQIAWANSFENMSGKAGIEMEATSGYLEDIFAPEGPVEKLEECFDKASANIDTALGKEGVLGDTEAAKDATDKLTNSSKDYAEAVNDKVIPALGDEIGVVKTMTDAYIAQKLALDDLIEDLEDYIELLQRQIKDESELFETSKPTFGTTSGNDYFQKDLTAHGAFDVNTDYSKAIESYLLNGGSTSDEEFAELWNQRRNKLEYQLANNLITQDQYNAYNGGKDLAFAQDFYSEYDNYNRDTNTDYTKKIKDYLINGGSVDSKEFEQLWDEREAKIANAIADNYYTEEFAKENYDYKKGYDWAKNYYRDYENYSQDRVNDLLVDPDSVSYFTGDGLDYSKVLATLVSKGYPVNSVEFQAVRKYRDTYMAQTGISGASGIAIDELFQSIIDGTASQEQMDWYKDSILSDENLYGYLKAMGIYIPNEGKSEDHNFDNIDISSLLYSYVKGNDNKIKVGKMEDDLFKGLVSARNKKLSKLGKETVPYESIVSQFTELSGLVDKWLDGSDKSDFTADQVSKINDYLNNNNEDISEERLRDILKYWNILGFDTGGYTGAWGKDGKLAVLHEKELVLNAQDTENLLNAVSLLREVISVIDLQSKMASYSNLLSSTYLSSQDQVLEQRVEIHAEFPAATDRYEIEEAFNSLVNKASQYANRKR